MVRDRGRDRPMMNRRNALSLIGGTAVVGALGGGGIPAARAAALPRAARAEEVGLSTERLARVAGWLRDEVAANRIPGAVVVVGRKGRVAYEQAVGFRDRDSQAPMRADSVFRIASMTKPITSVAGCARAGRPCGGAGKLACPSPPLRLTSVRPWRRLLPAAS